MTNYELFIVRARTKRGRAVYFLANFNSLIEHKHIATVQYYDKDAEEWIDFADVTNGTRLADNVKMKKTSLSKLGGPCGNIYYGYLVKFDIYDEHKKYLFSKTSRGNPTEFYGYLKRRIKQYNHVDPHTYYYTATIVDQNDWYTSRINCNKRKGDSETNFTIVHY